MARSSGPCRDQRGLSGSVQVTLLLPLAMLVLLAALQWSLLLWAESTAMAAAQDSARAAAVLGVAAVEGPPHPAHHGGRLGSGGELARRVEVDHAGGLVSTQRTSVSPPSMSPARILEILRFWLGLWEPARC